MARWQRDANVGLFKWCHASPGALCTAPPCPSGNGAELESWRRIQRQSSLLILLVQMQTFSWRARSHIQSVQEAGSEDFQSNRTRLAGDATWAVVEF